MRGSLPMRSWRSRAGVRKIFFRGCPFLSHSGVVCLSSKNESNMKEFLFIYRADLTAMAITPSPEEMQRRTKTWMDWMGSIAAKGQLVSNGNRLMPAGKVLRPEGVITDG